MRSGTGVGAEILLAIAGPQELGRGRPASWSPSITTIRMSGPFG